MTPKIGFFSTFDIFGGFLHVSFLNLIGEYDSLMFALMYKIYHF